MSNEELHEFRLVVKGLRKNADRMDEISNEQNDCELGDIADELKNHLAQFNA